MSLGYNRWDVYYMMFVVYITSVWPFNYTTRKGMQQQTPQERDEDRRQQEQQPQEQEEERRQ